MLDARREKPGSGKAAYFWVLLPGSNRLNFWLHVILFYLFTAMPRLPFFQNWAHKECEAQWLVILEASL